MDDPRLRRLAAIAEARCAGAEPAHDHLHVRRVAATAHRLALAEGADAAVATAAALLHELYNLPKGHPDSHLSGERCADEAAAVLRAEGWPDEAIARVHHCVRVHSFSRGLPAETLEAKVLQDADRLDAIGAIGVARCFATCADMKRPFYSPDDPFCARRGPDDKAWGLDHFYKKLLVVGGRMHTRAAQALAAERTAFLRAFLDELAREIGE